MVTKEEIVETIGEMKINELLDLINLIEERFGITVPTPGTTFPEVRVFPSEDEEEDIQTDFTVFLSSFGTSKVGVIKVIREITNLGLREAKELVESVPCIVKEKISNEEAKDIVVKLEALGATAEIK